jgi:transposase-like protein
MRQKSGPEKQPAEDAIRDIRRATRRHVSAEEKIRIVLEGLRGEESIAELCRREGIASSMYYGWSKEFLEAGKRRLAGDTAYGWSKEFLEAGKRRLAGDSARRDLRRGEGPSPGGASVEGGRGRSHPRKQTAQKTYGPPRLQGV